MPIGIIGSLAICTVLYVLFACVLTGMVHYTDSTATPRRWPLAIDATPFAWLQDGGQARHHRRTSPR